jgi:hypothetical protein
MDVSVPREVARAVTESAVPATGALDKSCWADPEERDDRVKGQALEHRIF